MEEFSFESPLYSEYGAPFDPHVPFHVHINNSANWKPHASGTLTSAAQTFHPYLYLPLELILNILDFCDHQTLFRLTQTCSSIRRHTKALFWSHKAVWYHVSGLSILLSLPGSVKSSHLFDICPIFRSQIEQVELVLRRNHGFSWDQLSINDSTTLNFHGQSSIKHATELFACTFLRLYPSVKRIVIIDQELGPNSIFRIGYIRRVEENCILARAFPPHITVLLSSVDEQPNEPFPYKRSLYRVDEASQLVVVKNNWTRERVIPPAVPITGIVGEFLRLSSNSQHSHNIYNRQNALEALSIEAFEKFHFGGKEHIPFKCPHGCPEVFDLPGQYATHRKKIYFIRDHGWNSTPDTITLQFLNSLPIEFRTFFTSITVELSKDKERYKRRDAQLRDSWGEHDSAARLNYEKAFLSQLKNDPMLYDAECESNPREHYIFSYLQAKMPKIRRTK
jgi:F-box associated protein